MRLDGQVALVTGGGRGIGRAMAEALARAGAGVAVLARTLSQVEEVAAAIAQGGGRALALRADVTDERAVERAVAETEARLGPVSLLVNNAGGGMGALGPVWEVDPRLWWREVEVNLLGALLPARAVLARMLPRRSGRIINLASSVGTRPAPYASGYSCAKAGLLRLTDSLAASTAEHGIAVFAISPGLVRTAQVELLLGTPEGQRWAPEINAMRPEDWNSPDRAAALAVTLATGQADRLSGRFIHASDDLAELLRRMDEVEGEDLYTLRLRKLSPSS